MLWRSRVPLLALLVSATSAVGCGGPQRPPGPPPYDPVNSPEPATACPDQREAAKAAREDLLEDDSAAAREAAAAAVFAQAECERHQFDALAVDAPTQDALAEKLRAARTQYFTAKNLYEEVARYQLLRWVIGADTRIGELCSAFADKLRRVAVPAELAERAERANFLTEMSRFAQIYDHEATLAFAGALRAADGAESLVHSDTAVQEWIQSSCTSLSYLDPTTQRSLTLCRQFP